MTTVTEPGPSDHDTPAPAETRWGDQQCLAMADVADKLRVRPLTVQRMLREGEVVGFQIGPRGLWRVQVRDLAAYVADAKKRPIGAPRTKPYLPPRSILDALPATPARQGEKGGTPTASQQ